MVYAKFPQKIETKHNSIFTDRQKNLALALGNSVPGTDQHNPDLMLFSVRTSLRYIFHPQPGSSRPHWEGAAWESRSHSPWWWCESSAGPLLTPAASPKPQPTLMAHCHQSKFWKMYIDFLHMMIMPFCAANVLKQCFSSICQEKKKGSSIHF